MAPPVKSGPRYNDMINVPKVRVIDENGENIGVMYTREAIEQAVGSDVATVEELSKFLDSLFPGNGEIRAERKRTIDAGIRMRATAILRTNSNGSIGSAPSSGVPGTATRLLIGTDSGVSVAVTPGNSQPGTMVPSGRVRAVNSVIVLAPVNWLQA